MSHVKVTRFKHKVIKYLKASGSLGVIWSTQFFQIPSEKDTVKELLAKRVRTFLSITGINMLRCKLIFIKLTFTQSKIIKYIISGSFHCTDEK